MNMCRINRYGIYANAKNLKLVESTFLKSSFRLRPKNEIDYAEVEKLIGRQFGVIDSLREVIFNKGLKYNFSAQYAKIRELFSNTKINLHNFLMLRKCQTAFAMLDPTDGKKIYQVTNRDNQAGKQVHSLFNEQGNFVRNVHNYKNGISIVTNGKGKWLIRKPDEDLSDIQSFSNFKDVLQYCRKY